MQARTDVMPRARGGEYAVYFGLVFVISLIPAAAQMVVPPKGKSRRFFVTRAWSMAGEVTPKIFSAL